MHISQVTVIVYWLLCFYSCLNVCMCINVSVDCVYIGLYIFLNIIYICILNSVLLVLLVNVWISVFCSRSRLSSLSSPLVLQKHLCSGTNMSHIKKALAQFTSCPFGRCIALHSKEREKQGDIIKKRPKEKEIISDVDEMQEILTQVFSLQRKRHFKLSSHFYTLFITVTGSQ